MEDLISFEEPLEDTVIENANNPLDAPLEPSHQANEILQPTIIQPPVSTMSEPSTPQPSDRIPDPYPGSDDTTDNSSTESDLEAPPEPKQKIVISSNTLIAEKDHYVHFTSTDCNMVTPVGKLLLDTELINEQELLAAQPKKGQVIISTNGLFKTFSIIISDNFYEKPKETDIINGLKIL